MVSTGMWLLFDERSAKRTTMKKSSITIAAVVLLAITGLFLYLRIWAFARAVSITGPSAMHVGENGIVYIMSNNFLYLHDREGTFLDKIPMSKFGIDTVIGDFWAYNNGDILLRRQVDKALTITGEAELFARTGAGEKDRLGTGESILQRCGIGTFQCRNFGAGKNVFDKITAFSLMIDEEKGTTYLSDTVGHQLLRLDEEGNIVKKSNTPFQFPNQIVLDDDGLLYVADTNNHRIAAVKTGMENFGEVEQEFKIIHPRLPGKLTWPMSLAHARDGKWWVINADDNMSYGIVMILNEMGRFTRVVSLPRGADPLRLSVVDDRILITDPSLMRVYTAGQNGELSDDFGSALFKLDLSELRRERRFYEVIATWSIWALLALLGGSLILARLARVPADDSTLRRGGEPAGCLSGTRRYDYHSVLGLYRIKFAVITVMLTAALSFLFLISRGLTLFRKEFIPAALLGHFVVSLFTYLHLKRSYVEINEQGITYRGISRNIHSPWSGVRKISVYGNTSKITSDYGNFSIGAIEPSDSPPRGWLDFLRPKRLKFHKELIEEIQKRAPRAKVNISWLVRYQWKRL